MNVVFAGEVDIALVALWAFTLFFIGLVIYLHRESYREGHPLEDAVSGARSGDTTALSLPKAKTYILPFDRGTVSVPNAADRDPVDIAARRLDRSPGSPYVPTGNPLVDGVGPAAYAKRADVPDLDFEGHARIVPIGASGLWVAKGDTDPRGLTLYAVDGAAAGTVSDMWVDKADRLIRYLTVDTGSRSVLIPMTMCVVKKGRVSTDSVNASDFAAAPTIAKPDTITLNEEERIVAYFGGGYLYANAKRQDSII